MFTQGVSSLCKHFGGVILKKYSIYLLILILLLVGCDLESEINNEDITKNDIRISPIKEIINKKYDIEAENVDLIATDYDENIEAITYIFSYNNKEYIGDCFISNGKESENYSTENIIYINFQIMKDKKTPITTSLSGGVKKESHPNDKISYVHYYGWINDEEITEIVVSFKNNITHITPIRGKYYSVLRYSEGNELDYIRGLNNKKEIVFEYNIN
jgi:hypothetical protein